MSITLITYTRRLALVALLAAVCAVSLCAARAQAYYPTSFCYENIPNTSICHGPWVENFHYVANEETSPGGQGVCVTAQGYSGGYYNLYGWDCADGHVFYELPATTAYPTVDNPNTTTYAIHFDPYFG